MFIWPNSFQTPSTSLLLQNLLGTQQTQRKSNKPLGFLALIIGLCQFYRVSVIPPKHTQPPINRSFIDKYCMPRQVQQPKQFQQPQPAADVPPPPQQLPSLESISTHLQRMKLQMHTYTRHLADQQTTNHRGQMQLNDNFYYYTLHQHRQDPSPYPWPTPKQFSSTIAQPRDRSIFQEEVGPGNAQDLVDA